MSDSEATRHGLKDVRVPGRVGQGHRSMGNPSMDDGLLQMSSECDPTVGQDQYLVRPRGAFIDGHTEKPSTVIYVDSHRDDNDKRVASQATSVPYTLTGVLEVSGTYVKARID